jgi:hypothetical protein
MDRCDSAGRQLCRQYWRTAGAGHQWLSARHRPSGGVSAGTPGASLYRFFLGAQLDATVPVFTLPPELAQEALGPDSDPQNPLLREVGWNYLKGRLRSHPDVAERYYQDVFRERAEQPIV